MICNKQNINQGLDILLSLDGTEYTEDNGYWYKIEAREIKPSKERPHGIIYNLTLHDNFNRRILGFDNAHAIRVKKPGLYSGSIYCYDHAHLFHSDKGQIYEFESANKLLIDFFERVNQILANIEKGDSRS